MWLLLAILAFLSVANANASFAAHTDTSLAVCELGRRDPARAVPACTARLATVTDRKQRAVTYYNRGIALAKQNEPQRALDDLNSAIKLDPRWAFYFEDRAELLQGLVQLQPAISDYSTAIRMDPTHAFRYQGRAHAFKDSGDLDAALTDFNTAISIDPRGFRFFDRAGVFLARHNLGKALADYDETIRRNATFAEAYAKRGLALLELGQTDRALADTNQALEIDSNDPGNYVGRAAVFERLGKLSEAKLDLEAALSRNKDDPDARDAFARVVAALKTKETATAKTPLSTSPNLPAPTQNTARSWRRVALVIGNGNYDAVGRLPNAVSDARAMAQLFERDGFETVQFQTEVGLTAFRHALADFEIVARNADVAVVYFSGHGIESSGRNFLVPTDAKLTRDVDVEDEAVPLDRVEKAAAGARQLKLIILDACRNDPFRASMQRATTFRSVERGLARVDPDSMTLVAFSAAAGTVADDGFEGQHSPFTAALLDSLSIPGLDIRLALGRVHDQVVATTKGSQEPFTYGSLGGAETPLVASTQ